MEPLIEERLAGLNPEYRLFVESDFAETVAETLGEYHGFNERQLDVLENAITLYLLFFLNSEESVTFLGIHCDLDLESATSLFYAIKASLPEGLEGMIETSFATFNTISADTFTEEIAETEKMYASIQGLRTMAGDAKEVQTHEEPVYQSSQSSLLRPTTPPTPPAPHSSIPRWDTEH